MSYSIILPPFTLKFRNMSAGELKGYRAWFLDSIPARAIVLQNVVRADPDFATWKPDHSRASFDNLASWLCGQVETRPRTAEEIDEIKRRSAYDFGVPPNELTNRTFSLAMDVGMYFGETLRTQYPHLEWDQPLKSKISADFGQMVLLGFGRVALNPVHIAVTFCYGIASGRRTATRFDEIYAYWSRLADKARDTTAAQALGKSS